MVIVEEDGRQAPLRDVVAGLVEELSPVAAELGCGDELGMVLDVLEHGPSYLRQRRVLERGGSLSDVVDSLAAELRTDRPGGG